MHTCLICFRDGHDHPEECDACGWSHWPPPCCKGCPCGSWESYHPALGTALLTPDTASLPPKEDA